METGKRECLEHVLMTEEPEGNANLAVLKRKRCIEESKKIVLSTLHVSAIDYEAIPRESRTGLIGALHIPVSLIGPIKLGNPTYLPLALLSPLRHSVIKECLEQIPGTAKETIYTADPKGWIEIMVPLTSIDQYRFEANFRRLYMMMAVSLGIDPLVRMEYQYDNDAKIGKLRIQSPNEPWYFNPTIWDIHRIICGEPETGCIKKVWAKLVAGLAVLSTCKLFD